MAYLFRSTTPAMRILLLVLLTLFPLGGTAQSIVGLTRCCPNLAVLLEPATGDTTVVAQVGTMNDAFVATISSVVVDLDDARAFLVRNGRIARFDFATGTVTEGLAAPWATQLGGYDNSRDRLYVFATERDTLSTEPMQVAFTNYLVAYDPATEDTVRVAHVGEAMQNGTILTGDLFASASGPALADDGPNRLFTLRNGRLVLVDLQNGAITVDARPFAQNELVGYEPATDAVFLLDKEHTQSGSTDIYRTYLLRVPLDGGTPENLGLLAEAQFNPATGLTGDVYVASLGMAVYDAVGDRVFFNRNDHLLTVDLATGTVTEGDLLGSFRAIATTSAATPVSVVPGPSGSTLRLAITPNPSSGDARAVLTLAEADRVKLAVFDSQGRRMAVLHDGVLARGTHTFAWRAANLASGTYALRATTGSAYAVATATIVR